MPARDDLFFRTLPDGDELRGRAAQAASQRARILDGMARAVAERGYARVSVAHVIELAGVSRRTFYELFRDKEDCFLAAYRTGGELLLGDVVQAVVDLPADTDWRTRVRVALESYTRALAAHPQFARTLVIDVLGAGPDAVAERRQVQRDFAARLGQLQQLAVSEEAGMAPVPELFLRALVGGIAELVQQHILDEGAETLPELAPALTQLTTAVFEGARRPAPASPM